MADPYPYVEGPFAYYLATVTVSDTDMLIRDRQPLAMPASTSARKHRLDDALVGDRQVARGRGRWVAPGRPAGQDGRVTHDVAYPSDEDVARGGG
jgi:hypothetical protein